MFSVHSFMFCSFIQFRFVFFCLFSVPKFFLFFFCSFLQKLLILYYYYLFSRFRPAVCDIVLHNHVFPWS